VIRAWGFTAADREWTNVFQTLVEAQGWAATQNATVSGSQDVTAMELRDHTAEAQAAQAEADARFAYQRGLPYRGGTR